ncbi:hypothetical protein LVJ83_06725 [Uruburuella testudinis]|uniref:Secreted protein n=1 Tax=Uruburuella testudinis TaxID=1282863 RepID=A0ABY4DWZ7_9NEIS|nr:hypothetical protein [Uruburuella testudinis]UOO83145.1 hypothetical protein LVJ83_06725 [Uruburuella testudinis]
MMKVISKIVALTLVSAGLAAPLTAAAMGNAPVVEYDGSGWCTKEYNPVPYVTKEGNTITAPNPCIAAAWKAQGR